MFPIRATGRLRPPTTEQVIGYGRRHHLELDADAAHAMVAAVTAGLAAFDRIDEISLPAAEIRHTRRNAGRAPRDGEDPFNAVVRFCEVRGAEQGPLAGRTVAVKDCISVAGVPTTNGGRRQPYAVPTEDAVVVERLLDAGATITMKTNLEDMQLGLGEGSFFGGARNPANPQYATGGSSSGSAAAVAAGMVDMALGIDSAGSVRIPAAWCGLTGMKATLGMVPTYGITHFSGALEFIGPITRNVADNALMLQVIAGHDCRDPQWGRVTDTKYDYADITVDHIRGLRVGVIQEAVELEEVSPDVTVAFNLAREALEQSGAQVTTVSVPLWSDARTILNGIMTFGQHALMCSGSQLTGHLGGVDTDVAVATLAQLRLGAADLPPFLKTGLVTAEYLHDAHLGSHLGKAQNLRLELWRQVEHALAEVDVLVTPTTPTVACKALDHAASDVEMMGRIEQALTAIANTCPLDLTGHPALTVPCGTGDEDLPLGLQFIGRYFAERELYRAGGVFEKTQPSPPRSGGVGL